MTPQDASTDQDAAVSVIGLGAMGSAIARAFLDKGVRTTVWNRSPGRAGDLAADGATVAADAAEAVTASPVTVVCVLDASAVSDVLGDIEPVVGGRVIVSVTSCSPGDARAQERRVARHGGDYLDGRIMADPQNVGTSRASFDFSGAENVFRTHEATLQLLGDVSYHGDDPGAAAVQFQAQVGMGYELLIGFLHTVRLVSAEGLEPEKFAERFAGSLSGYAALLPMMAKAVTNTEYVPDLGPLTVQAPLMDDLIEHRVAVGVDALRMREVKRLMDLRIAQGHGDEGFSSLFEVLDQESATKGSGV